jgi:hypothetical protein
VPAQASALFLNVRAPKTDMTPEEKNLLIFQPLNSMREPVQIIEQFVQSNVTPN